MISLAFFRSSNCSNGTVGRTTGSRSGRYGFESQPLHTFLNFINTTEKRDTPFLCMINLETRTFLKPGRVPLRNFSVLWEKKISKENVIPRLLFSISCSSIPEIFCSSERFLYEISRHCEHYTWKFSKPDFWNTEGLRYEYYRHCETEKIQRKIVISLPFFCRKYKNQWWNWCL